MPIPLIIGAAGIAAAAAAIKKSIDGYTSHAEASDILDSAKKQYNEEFTKFQGAEKSAMTALDQLGALELKIGSSFHEFGSLADELMGRLQKQGKFQDLKLNIPKHKLQQIKSYSATAVDVLGSIAGAGVAGASAGFAVYGGVMSLAAASTGTAISTLSGAAATNATLAAIGGGSLASGGLGIAGGTALLGGAVVAPILAVAAWAYAKHGEEAVSAAKVTRKEMMDATIKTIQARGSMEKVEHWGKKLDIKISSINLVFLQHLDALKKINAYVQSVVDLGLDPDVELQKVGEKVLLSVQNGYAIAAILVDVLTTPLFKVQKNDGAVLRDTSGNPLLEKDADGSMILNDVELDQAMTRSDAALAAAQAT